MTFQAEDTNSGQITEYSKYDDTPFDESRPIKGNVAEVTGKPERQFAGRTLVRKRLEVGNFDNPSLALKGFIKETKILRAAQHFHVIELVTEYYITNDSFIIIMDRADYNMADLIQKEVDEGDMEGFARWFTCLATAMEYIHGIGVRHRDIKPENILIKGNKVLLADFGISTIGLKMTVSTTFQGRSSSKTNKYAAPEVLDGGSRDYQADIFSLGAVFLEMIHAHSAWNYRDQLTAAIGKNRGTDKKQTAYGNSLSSVHSYISTLIQTTDTGWFTGVLRLCRSMLNENPFNRPTSAEVLDCLKGLPAGFDCDCDPNEKSLDDRLVESCRKRDIAEVNSHLEKGADPKALAAIHYAATRKGRDFVRALVQVQGQNKQEFVNRKNLCGETPLHCAVGYADADTVRYLLEEGADITICDDEGRTALHCAAAYGNDIFIDLFRQLRGGPLIAILNHKDRSGRTALICAVMRGHNKVARILINLGAKVNLGDEKGRMPLHFAARFGCLDTVDLLLDNKANVSSLDIDNYTPLFYASGGKREGGMFSEIMKKLLDAGAVVDYNQLHPAAESGEKEREKILLHAMYQKLTTRTQGPLIHELSDSTMGSEQMVASRYDLIIFLATVQSLRIDILPITWQAALQPIGGGATGMIYETVIDIQTSLAFKRVSKRQRERETESRIFRAFINEITVLGTPLIRRHPNIVNLLGVSWDVASDGKVWPVLVFEKSRFGDLEQFLRSPEGVDLNITGRMMLCMDIGRALVDMHRNRIIHGDIKPENVLVFETEFGGYTAKVIDFGYSTRFANEDDLIPVPKSWPWHAPEHHADGFKPAKARKMDVFSFGVLCLWTMFEQTLSATTLPSEENIWASEAHLPSDKKVIEYLKKNDQLFYFGQRLLRMNETLGDDEKMMLEKFFAVSMVYNPAEREEDVKRAFGPFIPGDPPGSLRLNPDVFPVAIESLELAQLAIPLYQSDYRVRQSIRHCLEARVLSSEEAYSSDATRNLAFQLAFCYEMGFGGFRNLHKSRQMLLRSHRAQESLDKILGSIEQQESQSNNLHSGNTFHTLAKKGHILPMNLADMYRRDGKLEEAERETRREVSDVKYYAKSDGQLFIILTRTLAWLCYSQERWEDTEELYKRLVDMSKKAVGPAHPDTLSAMANLAVTITKQGRWKEAEELQLDVMELAGEALGKEHPITLDSMASIAQTYRHRGYDKKAEELEVQVVETRAKVLGLNHPSTQSSLEILIGEYLKQMKSTAATELIGRVRRIEEDEHIQAESIKLAAQWTPYKKIMES